jgi:hypothetical protein
MQAGGRGDSFAHLGRYTQHHDRTCGYVVSLWRCLRMISSALSPV